MNSKPTAQDIEKAHDLVSSYINYTPVYTSESINKIAGAEIYFKCENFQKVGAFKARGGMNAILSLSDEAKQKGVATHSSGNHAQAVALAAKVEGIPAHIVMPSNSAKVKMDAVRGYGANLIECEPTLQAREDTLQEVVEKTGATMIHPYNDYYIITGQATAAKELIEGVNDPLDYILTPVGGGGLLSGTSLSAHYWSPETKVIGCEPEGADDAYRSFNAKTLIPMVNPNTIADGLRTSVGEKPFQIILEHVSDILLTNDEEIAAAMKMVWERMKIIIEPSAAVPLAVVLRNKEKLQGKKVGIIISGGNVDLGALPF